MVKRSKSVPISHAAKKFAVICLSIWLFPIYQEGMTSLLSAITGIARRTRTENRSQRRGLRFGCRSYLRGADRFGWERASRSECFSDSSFGSIPRSPPR